MVVFALISAPVVIGLTYIPHVVKSQVLKKHNAHDNKKPRIDKPVNEDVDALVERCNGAHYNQLETLGPYTAGLAAAIAVGVPDDKLSRIAATYVTSRVVYNVAYLSPQVYEGTPRSLAFAGAMGSILWLWVATIIKARENNAPVIEYIKRGMSTESIACVHP